MSSFVVKKQLDTVKFMQYLDNAQKTNQFSNYGYAVQTLEQRARELLLISDEKAIIATSSGASALQAILYSIQRKYGILPIASQDFTFPCNFQGLAEHAIPIDLTLDYQINLTQCTLHDAILIVTNCFGNLQDIDSILQHAVKYNQKVIFDNAATPYSFWKSTNSCNLGFASFISLHHTKPIGFGEGGLAIVDKSLEKYVRSACDFGRIDGAPSEYGNNFKMSELAAASILQWWDQFNIEELAAQYREGYAYKLAKYSDKQFKVFRHYGDEHLFPSCLSLVHHKETSITAYPEEDAKKYYKPFHNTLNSLETYKQIVCLPITEFVNEQ